MRGANGIEKWSDGQKRGPLSEGTLPLIDGLRPFKFLLILLHECALFLVHLVEMAVEATPEGRLEVRLRARLPSIARRRG